MKPVTWPREDPSAERLLWVDPDADAFGDARVGDLPIFPRSGDLLVVNDAATLPASIHGQVSGLPVEVRLAGREAAGWTAVVFGAGDWHLRTEERQPPPPLHAGAVIELGGGLAATVTDVRENCRVLLSMSVDGDRFWSALYQRGSPVQYSHVEAPLSLFHVQTAYASRPWAAEMPSAGRPLTWSLLLGLRARGVGLARVTHAAGLSSVGDARRDATLPWPERFDIPAETVTAVARARAAGGRVIAVGTSVVRALEGAALLHERQLAPGEGTTNLVIGPGFAPSVVDALFTGLHEATASHFALLRAFAPLPLLERAYEHAVKSGYRGHEFGDSCLIARGAASSAHHAVLASHAKRRGAHETVDR